MLCFSFVSVSLGVCCVVCVPCAYVLVEAFGCLLSVSLFGVAALFCDLYL